MASSVRFIRPGLSALIFFVSAIACPAQAPDRANGTNNPSKPVSETPYVLQVTTREVLVDVIAVDSHNQPIVDLAPGDLEVVEKIRNSPDIPEVVSSLRLIDPNAAAPDSLPGGGFRIAANESCLQRHSIHYQVAYNPGPQGLTSGEHQVLIRTRRHGAHLFYRHSYYIGATAATSEIIPQKSPSEIEKELLIDACSHPVRPLSISLRAARISTGSEDLVRYSVAIESGSLAFVSFPESRRQLQLDYGACNFNAAGKPLNYMKASTDQVLTPVEFARAQAHGFNRLFEFTPPKDVAMTRFVVRDRTTGNLGLVDVVLNPSSGTSSPASPPAAMRLDANVQKALDVQERADFEHVSGYHSNADDVLAGSNVDRHDPEAEPVPGPVGSYGSVVPAPHAFCGDVFELHPGIRALPDFRELDPIGSIYTNSLEVPYQNLPPETGIPGVTDRIAWFGVDYHATFWISEPGRYEFKIMSDDGARLQIDDKKIVDIDGLHTPRRAVGGIVLDAGRHTIHVPYFEGTPTGVALALWVLPPHGTWKIFDLRDFSGPEDHAVGARR